MQKVKKWIPKLNWNRAVAIFVIVTFSTLIAITPTVASAESGQQSQSSEAGLGIASGLLTIVYLPFKLAYAVLGGVVGGFAWGLGGGDVETGKAVWEPSFYGTYVITPSHLRGDEPVRFVGVSPYDEDEKEYKEIEYDEEAYEEQGKKEMKGEAQNEIKRVTPDPPVETPAAMPKE